MKNKFKDTPDDIHPFDRSSKKRYDDFNIFEPNDIDLTLPDDDDDELSDYTLMDNAIDLDYDDFQ